MNVMIKANELRLGNIIQDFIELETNLIVYKIEEDVITCGDKDFSHPYLINSVKPIPLTPEIMQKTGLIENTILFSAPQHIEDKSAKDEGIRYCSFFFNKRLNRWMDCQTRVCVDYVHQLQNLYFALTGEELAVTLPTA